MAEALRTADYRVGRRRDIGLYPGGSVCGVSLADSAARAKIRLSFPRVAGLFLIGMFYNQFLPGGTGGDIIKSYLLLKETPDKKRALCSR